MSSVKPIPTGWKQKHAGKLTKGDKVWMPKKQGFFEPDTAWFSEKVRDYICVITKKEGTEDERKEIEHSHTECRWPAGSCCQCDSR